MADDSAATLDRVDWQLLEHLQRDGRVAVAELARRVNLGPTATADRIRRLTDLGVIAARRRQVQGRADESRWSIMRRGRGGHYGVNAALAADSGMTSDGGDGGGDGGGGD